MKLVLVWGDYSPIVKVPLEDVTQEVYNELTSMFGTPKGRTENLINELEEEEEEGA